MSFKKNGYQIVKNVISRELCDFICTYLLLKENAAINMYQNKLVKPHDYFGVFVPYNDLLFFLLATPWVSKLPRNM